MEFRVSFDSQEHREERGRQDILSTAKPSRQQKN
jgi:hypothetical protein